MLIFGRNEMIAKAQPETAGFLSSAELNFSLSNLQWLRITTCYKVTVFLIAVPLCFWEGVNV